MASPWQKYRAARRRPSAGESELRFRRIDPLRFGWRASLDEQFGEGAAAAADVDPSQARGWCQPIEEDLSHELAPDAHPTLVSFSIIKTNGLLGHWRRPAFTNLFQWRQIFNPKDSSSLGQYAARAGGSAQGRTEPDDVGTTNDC